MSNATGPSEGSAPLFEFKSISDDAHKAFLRADLNGKVITVDKDGTLRASTGWLSAWWANRKIASGERLGVEVSGYSPPTTSFTRGATLFRKEETFYEKTWQLTAKEVDSLGTKSIQVNLSINLNNYNFNGYNFDDYNFDDDNSLKDYIESPKEGETEQEETPNNNQNATKIIPGDDPRDFD